MSQSVNHLCTDIRNRSGWKVVYHNGKVYGIAKQDVRVTNWGNTRFLSVIDLHYSGNEMQLREVEKFKLESAVMHWFKYATVTQMQEPYEEPNDEPTI